MQAGRNVRDLFEDLRDGHNLLSLLEVLSGEILVRNLPGLENNFNDVKLFQPRERGRMRFHAIQNVETALRFLRYKEIKLVNIRGEDIVDGNPKLTLGLIWTIILHFQVGDETLHLPTPCTWSQPYHVCQTSEITICVLVFNFHQFKKKRLYNLYFPAARLA